MRLAAPPIINTDIHHQRAAEAARWLVALLTWITGALDRYAPLIARIPLLREAAAAGRLAATRSLRRAVRDLRIVVTNLAFARMTLHLYRRAETLRPGDKRRVARARFRLYHHATGGLLTGIHRGSLRQRAERLARTLANLEPLIARTLKRLIAMWRWQRTARHALIVARETCVSLSLTPRAALADTS